MPSAPDLYIGPFAGQRAAAVYRRENQALSTGSSDCVDVDTSDSLNGLEGPWMHCRMHLRVKVEG